jgi:O-antigen/teichoic acid export membrane protein
MNREVDEATSEPGLAGVATQTTGHERDRRGGARLRLKSNKHSGYGDVARAALFWTYLRSFIYTIVVVPSSVILARLLSPSDFGIAAAATFFGQLAARLSAAGMGVALIRVKSLRDEHISVVFLVTIVLNVVAFATLVLAAPVIGTFYRSPDVARVMPLVALNFVVAGVSTVPRALLSRDLRYKELSACGTIDMLVALSLACLLAWLGYGYWSLIVGELVGASANGLVTWHWAKWRPRVRFSRTAFRELFSFGLGSYAKRLLDHAAQNVDNLVVGRVLGISALGFYDKGFAVGQKLYNRMTVIGPGVSFRIFSIIQDEPERFRRGYRKVVLSTTLIGYPVFAGLAAVAHPLFLVAFGEKWLPSVLPFQILCTAFMLKLTNTYAGSASQARGWIWSQVWREGVNVACIVIGAYLLSPWGIVGAAVAVLASTILLWAMMQHLLRSATHFGWRDILEPQIPALLCSVGILVVSFGAALAIVRNFPDVSPWVVLLAQIFACAAFYLGFLRFSGFKEVSTLVGETLAQISPKLARLARVSA